MNAQSQLQPNLTAYEYPLWERQQEMRHEYIAGEIFALIIYGDFNCYFTYAIL